MYLVFIARLYEKSISSWADLGCDSFCACEVVERWVNADS